MTVSPPPVDELDIDLSQPVTTRDWDDAVRGIMRIRNCSWPRAEEYIEDTGFERVERELRASQEPNRYHEGGDGQ